MLTEKQVEKLKSGLKEAFSDYYELAGGKNFRYHHLVRCHRYARKLMEVEEIRKEDFDPEVVEVATLFHDIGRSEDIEDGFLDPIEEHEGHAEKGEELVEEYIDILEEEKMEKVKKIIGNHHSEPSCVEGKIMQDADSIGKFGALDIWRLIHYASDTERPLHETYEYFWDTLVEKNSDKLDDLNFEHSRKVAKQRLESYKEVMSRIEEEDLGEDIL